MKNVEQLNLAALDAAELQEVQGGNPVAVGIAVGIGVGVGTKYAIEGIEYLRDNYEIDWDWRPW